MFIAPSRAVLSSAESLYGRWNVDRDEPIGGEQVIFAALIDNPHIAVSFSVAVGHDAINLNSDEFEVHSVAILLADWSKARAEFAAFAVIQQRWRAPIIATHGRGVWAIDVSQLRSR
jgi:hypothetical protein